MSGPRSRPGPAASLALLALALLLVLPAGCGKKGPPRLPKAEERPAVGELTHTVQGDEVLLRWTPGRVKAADPAAPVAYRVYQAAESLTEGCRGCPLLFRPAAEAPRPAAGEAGAPLSVRLPLEKGYRYTFKVAAVDGRGRLGGESNLVTFEH
jgi:predicted small lipoprotein YifL